MHKGKKLLILCGPTGVGKSALALKIAEQLNGEILSADSRQFYKGLPILTGKDIPKSAVLLSSDIVVGGKDVPYWQSGKTRIWGMDFLDLGDESHSSVYALIGIKAIADMLSRRKLPIVAGGTGMYIEALLGKYDTVHVPRNDELRLLFEAMSVEQLQERLMDLDLVRFGHMNESDSKNKRRLIRAVEVAIWRQMNQTPLVESSKYDVLWIGLVASKPILDLKIQKRVETRWDGAVSEVKELIDTAPHLSKQSETILGLGEIRAALSETMTEYDARCEWIRSECQYAKRQLVWFRKNPDIFWYDVSQPNWENRIDELITRWYDSM